ncbi:MMPL family transporter [Cupriavidus gilardii]|uniref:hopanoid transporter HpnN n=1 Tax=Cupriavidus gilardii TaxID=82541 RepID=UPI001ABE57B3|nr:MMPL family transporter [Cupriavidus gilardii]MBO4122854.1 MMPL family transporter [Cupriavidus gilardii]
MLTAAITRLVMLATTRAWLTIALAAVLCAGSSWYAARHFAINTDIGRLLDVDAPWARYDAALNEAFPDRDRLILAVVRAPVPELAEAAADALAQSLRKQPSHFEAVRQPGGGAFFARHGLLFLDTPTLARVTRDLTDARPLLNALARDPTLRGLADTLSVTLGLPLQMGQVTLAQMAPLLARSAMTLEQVLAGRPAALSWRTLADPTPAAGPALAFVAVSPVLDYGDLQAGADASAAIRASAAQLQLAQRYGADVRLTGPQALSDEEFASVADGAALNGAVTVLVVILILWLALRSARLIVAVLLSLFAGLAVTAALGLAMVGALNMISVAFAVLFVGLGVDFGIQFGVRYRAERHDRDHIVTALCHTAQALAVPLSLAAAATAAAFFAFLPTDYRGVAELGLIAGVGMFVAFFTTVTLLPALIRVLRPDGETVAPGIRWLAPADAFFERHRTPVLWVTCGVIVAASPLLTQLRFDFDPLNLKDPASESMATLRALKDAPQAGTEDVSVLAPSLDAARALATRLSARPEIARVTTLDSFVPPDQDARLPLIANAAQALLPALTQPAAPPATDALRVAALRLTATRLELAANARSAPGTTPAAGVAEARRLAQALRKLADADGAARDRAERAIALPLQLGLAGLTQALQAERITIDSLPRELVRDWLTPDGRALVTVSPRLPPGERAREAALDVFVPTVLAIAPEATGGPIAVRGSAHTILGAFAQAGAWAVLSIAILLWLTLRRFGDVLRTLVPLLVSAVLTLELCVVFGIALNFANVIALPLLLGIGVAFKIYYVIAWREGKTGLLQSSLTHAVLFSAATTATAFGSLWLSNHAGTASMGKLLALSLVCTLAGAVFFQPILMGRPRQSRGVP